MTDDQAIESNLDRAESCWVTALEQVTEDDLDRPSGCLEWSNAELINHLVGGGLRYAKLLAQAPPSEVEATRGQNHLGDDMVESFWIHERSLRTLAGECDLDIEVNHRIGPISGRQLLRMRILELALHAADLSAGTGKDWPIDEELAAYMSTELAELIVELGSAGGYAQPKLEPSVELAPAQRVLRISGR